MSGQLTSDVLKNRALSTQELSKLGQSFDYIVVGGGSAGCCLASRLSEDPSTTVLLIERGIIGDDWVSRVPLLSANYFRSGAPSTVFPLLPLKHANDRILHAVIGEGLGGGSRINSTVYTRGVGDYNLWRDMGHPDWSYERMEPYFIKSERTLSQPASNHRGKSGPWINQSFPDTPFDCMKHFLRAVEGVGIPQISDVNSPTSPPTCCACLDTTIDSSMRRVSTMDAFLPRNLVEQRSNLTICAETIVTRLKLDATESGLRAVGVLCEPTDLKRLSRSFYVKANREVILCAGAVASPQLLMLSGIGPASHLATFGIKVLKDLPGVGSYLKDHPNVPVMYQVPMDDSMHFLRNKPLRTLKELFRYLVSGRGLFGRAFLNWTVFVQTSHLNANMEFAADDPSSLDATQPQNLPDIEIMPVPHRCSEEENSPLDKLGLFSMMACLVKPKSHGTVRLASADPHDRAAIDVAFLHNAEDYAILRKGVRLSLRVAELIGSQGYPLKPIAVPASDTDDDLDTYIREYIRTSYHYACTCRMAPEDDPQPGVVDDYLRVHGIQGLRICDASVFPEIVSTHTMAPAVAVAEKCADLIKAELRT